MKNCLIIAGEKSGEDHVMSFLPKLMSAHADYQFWGVGGEEMESCSVELLYHLKEFSSWGFSGVISKIPFYKRALDRICKEVVDRKCKVAILVDFQGFNMRLAARLKKLGVKVLYYVAPQAWVWKEGRVKKLRKNVHTLFTILPFEKQWFRDRGVDQVVSVSHPLYIRYKKESLDRAYGLESKSYDWMQKHPHILLLPGSRHFEVQSLLPTFIKALQLLNFPVRVGLVKSSSVDELLYAPYLKDVDIVYQDHELDEALKWASVSLAASGTVTLTCALFQVPTIMAYQSSFLNEYIFYELLGYDGYITLPNIILGKEVFPELIQNRATSFNMSRELVKLMTDVEHYDAVKKTLTNMRELIRGDIEDVSSKMSELLEDAS